MPGKNMATLSPAERDAISAKRSECLERYKAALDLASRIYSQRQGKGKGWRMWAERELAAQPELEKEARAKLNRLVRETGSDRA